MTSTYAIVLYFNTSVTKNFLKTHQSLFFKGSWLLIIINNYKSYFFENYLQIM